ncbi:site-specific DNA-methyltransferase [Mesomycoplasma ovipneumoniae]|uniref:site-specific DNA-methyltransferase n=1 Tax=Mesomycoplasma ovipneumoniae TaxID=29562 RepID=UPI00296490D8|nr:site-specific DNA-methyltransferase [Mesomycoplasma ovipneumoniae]MDW2870701.1 site-specific DNA-methyltransferase [Mesomycoplasma ovipneumoniae]
MDPPYNTQASFNEGNQVANDKENILPSKFIYRDKYSRNGWLNLLNERLNLAKKLLKEDGIIFISIDDNQQAYLKVLMDEIFGEENFVANFPFISNLSGRQVNTNLALCHEYLLLYKKNNFIFDKIDKDYANNFMPNVYPKRSNEIFNEDPDVNNEISDNNSEQKEDNSTQYILSDYLENSNGEFNPKTRPNLFFPIYARKISEKNKLWDITVEEPDSKYDFIEIWPRKNSKNIQLVWRWGKKKIMNQINDLVIVEPRGKNDKNYRIKVKKFDQSYTVKSFILGKKFNNKSATKELDKIFSESSEKVFNFPKPTALIEYLINLHPNKNARVLDFFAGSGTTGHAVWNLNRQDGGNRTFTLITNNQNKIATDVTYERLFRVSNGKGTKNQEFNWSKNNKPYLQNLKVFDICYYNTQIFDSKSELDSKCKLVSENGLNGLVKLLLKLFKDFDIKVDSNHIDTKNTRYIELLNHLLALKPQEKDS